MNDAAQLTTVRWSDEISGALSATAAILPFVLIYGVLVYGALGSQAAYVGLTASVIAVVIGGVTMLAFSRTRMPTASPSASSSLVLGGAVLILLRDPALRPDAPGGLALLLAAIALVVVVAGVLLGVLGALRIGVVVRFVPQPVMAGFMNGIAILIALSQVPAALGLPLGAWETEGVRSLVHWNWHALMVALFTAILLVAIHARWKRAPAPLIALVLAAVVVVSWKRIAPDGMGASLQQIGPLGASVPTSFAISALLDPSAANVLWDHRVTLLITTLLLTLICAMESVLNLIAVDQMTDDRSDPNRELIALGVTNVVSGLLGGLPLMYLRLRAVATIAGGGRSWRAVLASCIALMLVFTLLQPAVELLPTAVLAGVVVVIAWQLVNPWTLALMGQWRRGDRSADLGLSLGIIALVCAVTVVWGIAAGVLVGIVATMGFFIRAMRHSLIRTRFTGIELRSRRVRTTEHEVLLERLRAGIHVVELEGALFFGNTDRLAREVESKGPGASDVIVDLRRVPTIDASGAVTIAHLDRLLRRRGVRLRLGGVTAGNARGRALAAQGVVVTSIESPDGRTLAYSDIDRALEAAEDAALHVQAPGLARRAIPLADCRLFEALEPPQCDRLRALLREHRFSAGALVFRQGDTGQALYLLTAGSVSVVDAQHQHRFVSFSPGMCFGEVALLDGAGRSASAIADVDSVVYELPAEALASLLRDEPALAAIVYRNLSRHLSERLRGAAKGWQQASG